MIEQKVLEAYADGSPLGLIIESFNITHKQVTKILLSYKEKSRYKRTFTDEFRKMIAERDMNGVARSTIANELGLNVNTVKKACEKFGQAIKGKATSDKAFTKIEGEFSLNTCPSCGSKRNNLVDDKTTYCMSCDSEFEYHDGYVLKINFEYIEE
ncbi:MAG: hypothetical protein ABS939_03665 [Psychrobacillus sp.]